MADERAARLTGNQCFCPDCGEYFTTVRNFDRHLRGKRPICLDPASVGLERDAHGYWQMPGPAEGLHFTARERAGAADVTLRMPRTGSDDSRPVQLALLALVSEGV